MPKYAYKAHVSQAGLSGTVIFGQNRGLDLAVGSLPGDESLASPAPQSLPNRESCKWVIPGIAFPKLSMSASHSTDHPSVPSRLFAAREDNFQRT